MNFANITAVVLTDKRIIIARKDLINEFVRSVDYPNVKEIAADHSGIIMDKVVVSYDNDFLKIQVPKDRIDEVYKEFSAIISLYK